MLLRTLRRLEQKGNTVVVVEHDEETIRQAEYVVDLGPGAGVNGGRVVAEGGWRPFSRTRVRDRAVPGGPAPHPFMERRPVVRGGEESTPALEVSGARLTT